MAGVGVKIIKPGGEKLDKFEESVSQVSIVFFLLVTKFISTLYWASSFDVHYLEGTTFFVYLWNSQ